MNREFMQLSSKFLVITSIFVLNLPLLTEIVRKYVFQTNIVLPIADALIILWSMLVFIKKPTRGMIYVILWLCVAILWGLFSVLIGHQNIMLGAVGLRSIIVPVAVLIISIYLFQVAPIKWLTLVFYRIAIMWLLVMGFVAVLQVALGIDHPINQTPASLGGDERHGIGDYTVEGMELEWLFRPTSIFLHTGKFGQVAFLLASYALIYRYTLGITGVISAVFVTLGFGVLVLTGQRAALILYIIMFLMVYLFRANVLRLVIVISISALFYLLFLVVGHEGVGELFEFVFIRFISGIEDITLRFYNHLVLPGVTVLDSFGFLGAGLGMFSLGSQQWGGEVLYEVVQVGTAENSWLRIFSEIGLPGVLIFVFAILGLTYRAACHIKILNNFHDNLSRMRKGLVILNIYQILGLSLWANTHDVFGSATTMSIMLSYAGIIFSFSRLLKKPLISRQYP